MDRPNILICYTDQQRWDAVASNGNPAVSTPHLDRLAADGVSCDHCFVQNPVCMPSRISFLTGQYPGTLGITHMGVPVPEDWPVLPRLFAPFGYHTANLGKLHFLPHANRDHRVPHPRYGFDQLEISDEPGCYEDAYRAWVRRRDPSQLDHLSVGLPPATADWYRLMGVQDTVRHPAGGQGGRADFQSVTAFPGGDDYTHTAFVGQRTIDYLRSRSAGQPFLCVAGFYSPHSPWVAPQRYLDLYDRDRLPLPPFPPELEPRGEAWSDDRLRLARHGYWAMVSEVDAWVGRILETLEGQGLADNTIVVFTSDHGEWLGEHLRFGKGYPGFDSCTRVPLLIRWPAGLGRPGRRVSSLVEHVDVLPTLLEAAGLPLPPQLQGRSLLDLLRGRVAAVRDSALCEMAGWKTLRTEGYRYLLRADGSEQLYDLGAEHGAYRDVASRSDYAAVLADHRHRLATRLLERERPLPRTWPY